VESGIWDWVFDSFAPPPLRINMAPEPEWSNFTSTQEGLINHAKRVRCLSWLKKYLVQEFKNHVMGQRDSYLKQARLKPLNGSFFVSANPITPCQ